MNVTPPAQRRIVTITGATGGLGQCLVEEFVETGWYVLALHRKPRAFFNHERILELSVDLTEAGQVNAICEKLRGMRCDAMIHAAGWLASGSDAEDHQVTITELTQGYAVNVFAPLTLSLAVLPGMKARNFGRIVFVSSGTASYTYQGRGRLSYRGAKASLNYLTKCLAYECKDSNVLVNAACPGWMNTPMGGDGGRDPSLAVPGIKWLATLPNNGPRGNFFRDRQSIDW